MANRSEADVDQEYIKSLTQKLESLKTLSNSSKKTRQQVLDGLGRGRDQQLFELISGQDNKFEDNFVDTPLQANWLQRKVAPETVAISKQELVRLTRSDLLQKVADLLDTESLETDLPNPISDSKTQTTTQ